MTAFGREDDAMFKWLRGIIDKVCYFTYLCPRCGNGMVKAYNYGTYDQFESGKCSTCPYEYDGFTEDYL